MGTAARGLSASGQWRNHAAVPATGHRRRGSGQSVFWHDPLFFACLEIAQQFELAQHFGNAQGLEYSEGMDRQLHRLLQLTSNKTAVQQAIVRWKDHQTKQQTLHLSVDRIRGLLDHHQPSLVVEPE